MSISGLMNFVSLIAVVPTCSSHLLKSDNRNNSYISKIKKLYPNIVTFIPWRNKFSVPVGREIDAVVDFMICLGAQEFLGYEGSTFSETIHKILMHKCKSSHLFFWEKSICS